jgi:hypothetical protein
MQTELAEIWELEVAFLLKQATPDGCLVVVCGWLPCSCSPVALFLVPAMLGCFRDSDLVPPFCATHTSQPYPMFFFALSSISMA